MCKRLRGNYNARVPLSSASRNNKGGVFSRRDSLLEIRVEVRGTASSEMQFICTTFDVQKFARGIVVTRDDLDRKKRMQGRRSNRKFIVENLHGLIVPTRNRKELQMKFLRTCYVDLGLIVSDDTNVNARRRRWASLTRNSVKIRLVNISRRKRVFNNLLNYRSNESSI